MANMYDCLIGVVLIVSITSKLGEALTCLNCENVPDPRLCRHVTACYAGEKCGMETFISHDGSLQYNLGCVKENTCSVASTPVRTGSGLSLFYSCHDCCDNADLCNIRGCNITGYPSLRGPICYNCEDHPVGYPCHSITACETHEVCFNKARLDFETQMVYTSGCMSKHNCGDSQLDPVGSIMVGRRSTHVCSDCCDSDLCNVDCQLKLSCKDEPTCPLLMASYDICKNTDLARKVCSRSCNLCPTSTNAHAVTTQAYTTHVPTTQSPSTQAPTTQAPTTQRTTQVPTTRRTTQVPTTQAPTTQSTTQAPTTQAPTTQEPTTQAPTKQPKTTAPTTQTPTTQPPTTTTYAGPIGTTDKYGIRVGNLVVRGPDWMYGNQDLGGLGRIVALAYPVAGFVQVHWITANLTNVYRMDNSGKHGGKYDIILYNGTMSATSTLGMTTLGITTGRPVAVPTYGPQLAQMMYVGGRVIRGKDWKWDEQDSHAEGDVIEVPPTTPVGWVRVKWDNGTTNVYRMGAEGGSYDLMFVPGSYNPPSSGK